MNQGNFLGNLTCDPKLSQTSKGSWVVDFTIVTKRFFKRSNGETDTELTYLDMEAWDSGAKRISNEFKKGDGIVVESSAKNYTVKDTEGIERKTVVFRVNHFYKV